MPVVVDYTSLGTAVQDYLQRSDVGVTTGNLDYLIPEVEAELNSRLRVRRMLTSVTPTVSAAGVVTLPTSFGGWKRFQARDGSREWDLELKSAEEVTNVWDLYGSSAPPRALITTGSTSQIWPYSAGYTFAGLYYARIPQLLSTQTTNWVIANFPMVYLYGCLAAARAFVQDDSPAGSSRFEMWAQRFNRAVAQIEREDAKDLDARSNAVVTPDTTLFSGGSGYNVISDG